MKRMLVLVLVVAAFGLAGCAYTYSDEDGYRMAVINSGFPVPKNAYEIKPEACTGEIAKSAKYKLKDIGDAEGTPPAAYLGEIEKWGWTEVEESRIGNVHFFKKEGKIMSIVVQKNVFDLYELTEDVKL
ncbi:hypothetical protein OXB_0581 [Bacillus sp. OxB-1]|uniref:hypothetical protein n=1 Tax=Bacillus sp. (strain OxB-1) TaxID=98228 RepID=UPI000581C3CB|nr:hypothetical protein [Bacillus sp. OxB-1]BAQ09053.1 hypothetical protein OXB_0581 [Bacillus sp. OxB-1]